jgi:hypothetical protein
MIFSHLSDGRLFVFTDKVAMRNRTLGGNLAIGLPAFSLLYSTVLSDFVGHETGTGARCSADERAFAATGKSPDQSSASRRATDCFRSIVMTLIVGILGCLNPLVFTLGDLLCPTLRERPTL